MHIADDHMYHGAALIQIAERPEFKAINPIPHLPTRSALRINNDIAIYMKYAAKPRRPFKEYAFTFNDAHWGELIQLSRQRYKVFIVLVCIKAREICCVTLKELTELNNEHMTARGNALEPSCTLLVTALNRQRFSGYMNQPGRKKIRLSEKRIPRNAFPKTIFNA